MNGLISSRSFPIVLMRNVVAVVSCWIIGYCLVQVAQRASQRWEPVQIGQLVASVVGVLIAVRIRAVVAAYFIGATIAVFVSEITIHAVYGIGAAQGAPSHLAVLGAAIGGVLLGIALKDKTSSHEAPLRAGVLDARK